MHIESVLCWSQLSKIPDAEGFAGLYAGVHNEALIVAGGANFPDIPMLEGGKKVWHDRIFILEAPDETWQEAGNLPKPMAYGASATLPYGFLLMGGSNAEGLLADCLLLSWDEGELSCTEWPSLPHGICSHATAVLGGKVYLLGGNLALGEQDAESRMWVLDPLNLPAGWREAPAIPARGRFLHQMASFEDTLYVLGGIGLVEKEGKMARQLLTEAWSYSVAKGWQALVDMPYPIAAAPTPAPVSNQGRIFLFGGDNGTAMDKEHPAFQNQSLLFNITTQKWCDGGMIAAPRAVLPAVEWHRQAVIINGELRPGIRSREVWAVNVHTHTTLPQ